MSDRELAQTPEKRRIAKGSLSGPGARGVLLLAACAAMYWRVLTPGTLPYAHDTLAHDFPIQLWSWGEVARTGRLPLWIPALQDGLPTLGSFAWCPFYPTDWLMGLSVAGGFRVQWWLLLAIAGLGMAVWGRAAGLDVAGRWTAAIAFALSGHLVTLISPGHLQKAQAIAWLPWAMAAVEWTFRGIAGENTGRAGDGQRAGPGAASREVSDDGGWGTQERFGVEVMRNLPRAIPGGLATGGALGLQTLASHTQIAYLTALLVGWRAVWLMVAALGKNAFPRDFSGSAEDLKDAKDRKDESVKEDGQHREQSRRSALGFRPADRRARQNRNLYGGSAFTTARSAVLVGFVAWGICLPIGSVVVGGVELLPGVEMAGLSNRAHGVAYEEASQTSYPPLELLEYAFPRFLGDSVRGGWNSYVGEWGERLVTDYVGAGVVLLALIGLAIGRRRAGLRAWLVITAAGAAFVALGSYTPVHRLAYEMLPGFNRFRSPGTQMVLTAWSLSALAGVGLCGLRESVARDVESARRWFLGLATIAVLFPLASLVGRQASSAAFAQASGSPVEDLVRVLRHKGILLSSVSGTFFWVGVFAGALLGALVWERRWAARSGGAPGGLPPSTERRIASRASRARWVYAIPIAVFAVDLVTRLQPFISPEPEGPYLAYLYRSPGDVLIARDRRLPRRLVERGNELTLRPMLNGIDVPMGYHPVSFRWMQEAMEALGLESPGLRAVWSVDYVRTRGPEPPDRATTWTAMLETPAGTLWHDKSPPPFVRFPDAIAAGDSRRDLPILIDRFGIDPSRPVIVGVRNAALLRSWLAEGPAESWKEELPTLRPMDDFTTAVAATWREKRRTGTAAPGSRGGVTGEGSGPTAAVLEEGAGVWVARVSSPRPRWMVLSTVPAPGWIAIAGEKEPRRLPIFRGDVCSSLIPWPGGDDLLVLLYAPWSARLGIFLTLLAFAAAFGLVGWRAAHG